MEISSPAAATDGVPVRISPPPLEELFRQHKHREWHFVQPGGNWGDQLIYAGAEALARRLGLTWKDHDFRDFNPSRLHAGAAIYLHGSGGFNPWGSKRAFSNLKNALSVPDALVVQGPQTSDVLSEITKNLFTEAFQSARTCNVFFYARERSTLEFVNGTLPRFVSIGLDRDTALHLRKSDILDLANLDTVPAGRYHLLVSRDDDEVPNTQPVAESDAVVIDPGYFARSFEHWIRIHAFAKTIRSNRLHSSIAGAILGKPVTLMGGSYHKNKSIWEYSLKDLGVLWSDESAVTGLRKPAATPNSLSQLLNKSWKGKRALLWLKGVPLK